MENKWLANLETLKLQYCTLLYAIPSSILALLKNLKELEIRDSDQVEAIFDINDDTQIKEIESQLKILTLNGLSKLKHVWKKDTNKILIFRNLREIVVSDCAKLQTLFPASLAKNLKSLKSLQIQNCAKFHEIVEKEEDTEKKLVLPCLEKLDLFSLPQLTCFYARTFTLECPALNKISVVKCDKLELFQSAHSMGESTSVNKKPLISSLEVSVHQRINTVEFFPSFFLSIITNLNFY